ncbi:MAG TPA: DUF222 domain-containing protein [Candidatus Dormibacteraeota bacterium]|nr:DUF222 domain-containing protein [Candidatus Dormibacteraeota bacterium]
MLATQDLQPPAGTQLAFVERSVDGAEEAEELKQIFRQMDLLALRASGVAARFATKPYYEQQGYVSPIEWIRFECHQTSTIASDVIAVGENLERLPQTVQAVKDGEIGFPHLKTMARTANFIGGGFDEVRLLSKARDNSAGKFYYICDHYRHSLDPKGYEAEQTDRVENRQLKITTCDDGAVLIKGVFDPEGGAALRTAWEALARRSGAHDDRSRKKRLADAAVELAIHGMDIGLIPQQATQRTHLQVTVPLETLLGLPGAPGADLEFSPQPISAKTVERLACDASVTRIVLDPKSQVIDVGRAERTIKGPRRKALNVRDRGCTWPVCERPASWTSGHHIKHWLHGGDNQPSNLTLLCYRHHWMVHEGGWQIVRGDDGRMITIPPSVTFGPTSRGPD